MANGFTQAYRGLVPVNNKGGFLISPTTQDEYINPADNLSIGNNEIVILNRSGAVSNGYILPPSGDTANSAPTYAQSLNALGVLSGVYYEIPTFPGFVTSKFWSASTTIKSGTKVKAKVCVDPNQYYMIQTNSTTGLQQSQVGQYANLVNINYIDGNANGISGGVVTISLGSSTAALDLSTVQPDPYGSADNGGRMDVEIIGLAPINKNVFGSVSAPCPYNYAIVKLNSLRP